MFDAIGYPVMKLHRERFGTLALGSLKQGEWRELTSQEIESLSS